MHLHLNYGLAMMKIYLNNFTVEQYAEIGLWLWNDVCIDWQYDSENFLLTLPSEEDASAFRLRFGYSNG